MKALSQPNCQLPAFLPVTRTQPHQLRGTQLPGIAPRDQPSFCQQPPTSTPATTTATLSLYSHLQLDKHCIISGTIFSCEAQQKQLQQPLDVQTCDNCDWVPLHHTAPNSYTCRTHKTANRRKLTTKILRLIDTSRIPTILLYCDDFRALFNHEKLAIIATLYNLFFTSPNRLR